MNVRFLRRMDKYERTLAVVFLLSLPFVNPWVRGDGVGYYAYARALIVNRNLQFEPDWRHSNPSFRNGRVDSDGRIHADQYTATGHLDNHFSIGPALIWMPFLALTHSFVLGADHLGAHLAADGFSWPYLDTMALVTALAGFVGLLLSFWLSRKYFPERWAFLATLGIWFASSLSVYMYFNPSWSHAHSVFVVALFLWYWDRTRNARTTAQWAILGLISGLMMDMYYLNAVFLFVLVNEFGIQIVKGARSGEFDPAPTRLAKQYALFASALVLAFFPTLITRRIIYGHYFATGYDASLWHFSGPLWGTVLFSGDHGLFSWTPILLLASVGLLLLWRRDKTIAAALAMSVGAFYFVIATYVDWDGISSYGNRFFISLTPIFILGLAALLSEYERVWRSPRRALFSAALVIALLVVWNAGLIFQWGMHLIPDRGPISWMEMTSNQFRVVPLDVSESMARYFTARHKLMQRIEEKDLHQLDKHVPSQSTSAKTDK